MEQNESEKSFARLLMMHNDDDERKVKLGNANFQAVDNKK
jgi:hypothetical protein